VKVLITGSAGLIGYEASLFFLQRGFTVVGIDNNQREKFFGVNGSVAKTIRKLYETPNYLHYSIDIRDISFLESMFKKYKFDIIIHTAAQPSHDWAATAPFTDFSINATGTLNLLEFTRQYCPNAVFIHMSTNKVYGDLSNNLDYIEQNKRWSPTFITQGFDESFSIDQSKHSLFGVSKAAGDLLAQEYGRYFGLKTIIFRGGCLTGPKHAGVELHGFLSYLVNCALNEKKYIIYGYKGKQVRDNISSTDVISAFNEVFEAPPDPGTVYNIGGGLESNCSILEAIDIIEQISNKKIHWEYKDEPRSGDHIWWVSDIRKFKKDYPNWKITKRIPDILKEHINYG